jgi:TPR repeat protein
MAKFYLEGIGTDANLTKAEALFRRAHSQKNDDGTFGLINCMMKQHLPLQTLYQVYKERSDSKNGYILYKIGQGHILRFFGNQTNFTQGIEFLEKSILAGYRPAIRLLCISQLKVRFGFDKTKSQLFKLSKKLKESESFDERAYYGVCLYTGIGTRKHKREGMYIIDFSASKCSKVGKYFQKYLYDPNFPVWFDLFSPQVEQQLDGYQIQAG